MTGNDELSTNIFYSHGFEPDSVRVALGVLNHRVIEICHVLIIEDELFFAMDLQALLENEGATSFDLVDTHVDAVATAMSRRPAVITSDVQLYEGKGPAAVEEIRLLLGHVPVIYITATPHDCGAVLHTDIVLTKPLDRQALHVAFGTMQPSRYVQPSPQ